MTVILIQGEGGKRDRQDGLPSLIALGSRPEPSTCHMSFKDAKRHLSFILAMSPRRWLSYLKVLG